MTEPADYRLQDVDRYYPVDHAFEFPTTMSNFRLSEKRVLYVGCGRAEALELMGPGSVGVDFNDRLRPTWERLGLACEVADVREMPQFEDDAFDVTFSVDFLEHVQTGDVPLVVDELRRLAPEGVHVIDTTPQSGFRGFEGKNLHPSGGLREREWMRLLDADNVQRTPESQRHFLATWRELPRR